MAERTALHTSVVTEQTLAKSTATLRGGFKTFLQGRFGKESAELQKFGFTPQKPRQTAAATKAKAVKLVSATRKARGTTGKKAKVNIKGVVAPETVASTGPAGTAPPHAPADPKPSTSNPGPTA